MVSPEMSGSRRAKGCPVSSAQHMEQGRNPTASGLSPFMHQGTECSLGGPTATVALCGEKRVTPNALREKSCGVSASAREQLAKAPLATSPQYRDFHSTTDRCQGRAYFKTC